MPPLASPLLDCRLRRMTERAKGRPMAKTNLAGRAGRWSASNWKKAFFGWLVFAIAALMIGSAIGPKEISDSDTANGESARAEKILEHAGFQEPATESVLVQSRTRTASDPGFKAAIVKVVDRLAALQGVRNMQSPLAAGAVGQVSKDGHSALVQFDIAGKADTADERVEAILDAVAGVQKATPSFRIEEFGIASANRELNDTVG